MCEERFAIDPFPSPPLASVSNATRFEEAEGDNVALSHAGVLSAFTVQVDAVETFLPCLEACEGTAWSTNFLPVTSDTKVSFNSVSGSPTEETEVAGDE